MKLPNRDPAAFPSHAANPMKDGSPGAGRKGAVRGGKALRRGRPECRCGRCARCSDNARWERIFAEKFADPDYYTSLNTRCSSPLVSLMK
jgi:hypothetical protein